MSLDYYTVLDVRRDATDLQILQAYRRLALQWHPAKHPDGDSDAVLTEFQRISEAYDVLTNAERRAVFDYYGEKGLKLGVTTQSGATTAPYSLSTPPTALFDSVFGQASPYSALLSYNTTDALLRSAAPAKPAAVDLRLFLSLEELYRGCVKKVKVARKRLTSPPTTPPSFVLDERLLSVNVLAGYRAGTRITFAGEGDESTDGAVGDVTLTVAERPHPRLRRVKDDLLYTAALSLVDALCGVVVGVETLDDRVLSVALSEVCTPKGVKVVKGEGMPRVGGGRGDLLIHYDIAFPDQLTLQQKEQLRATLQ